MNTYCVEINYGRKCAAFETTVKASCQQDAIVQAKVLARMSGWSEQPKKTKVKELEPC